MSTPKTGLAPSYLHGFSSQEQDRLYHQARLLEESVYKNVDFKSAKHLLEVGCGVGAQTEILLERFPQLRITGVDASEAQLKRATERLQKSSKRVELIQSDALHLPFLDDTFDAAFICWFLEHVQEPVAILEEVRRKLAPQSSIVCNEVLNVMFYIHPYAPATQKYWFEFNDHQWNLKGDPFVGAKLANYLIKAGFQEVVTEVITHHYDNRMPKKRTQFIDAWCDLLLSGAPSLLEVNKVTPELVEEMKEELLKLKNDPEAVILCSWVQARAKAL